MSRFASNWNARLLDLMSRSLSEPRDSRVSLDWLMMPAVPKWEE
jgi:hypothetical protein